jgi:hypothetical protein
LDAIVFDFNSVYEISVSDNADRKEVLAAYMRVSGKGWRNKTGDPLIYYTTTHSERLYSIRRKTDNSGKILLGCFHELLIDIADWWVQAYPVLEQIATSTGALTGTAAAIYAPFKFVKWVRSKAHRSPFNDENGKIEFEWLKAILAEDAWSSSDLAEKLSLSKDEAKSLLQGFGYTWDSHKQLYLSTDHTKHLRELNPKTIHDY